MKYLVVARGFNEPDNNTPSDDIWARIMEFDPDDKVSIESTISDELIDTYGYIGVDVKAIRLDDEALKTGVEIFTIW